MEGRMKMQKTLVIILGPHAVGKMTVGQELEKITDLRLFHNHMSIELTRKLFSHSVVFGRFHVTQSDDSFNG